MRVLFLGEIVGSSGVFCVKQLLTTVKREKEIDFVIAGGDGATGGYGLGKKHSAYLHKLGIDVLTGGECIYYKRDMVPHIATASYILRPANYPRGNPGRGYGVFSVDESAVGVIVLLGQAGFDRVHLRNPYTYLPELIARLKERTNTIILDFHATTTAEKANMFYIADGTVSAIVGTHSKTITADERILPGGTAVITDVGRTGSLHSVGGLDADVEIQKLITQIPERSKAAWEHLELQGVIIDVDSAGLAISIERLRLPCEGGSQ